MIVQRYELAGHVLELRTMYRNVHAFWREYVSEGEPEFVIETGKADIEDERVRARRSAERDGRSDIYSTDEQLEALAVYRLVAEHMTKYGVLLFHGSAIAVDGEAYIFTAPSGTGKSTHAALWRKYLGDRAVMINDDKPMIGISPDGARVFGTPYNGKHSLGTNSSAPLRAICILGRGAENSICEITAAEAYQTIVQQTLRPRDPAQMNKLLDVLDKVLSETPLYRLGCDMSKEAVDLSFNTIRRDKQEEC